MKTFIRKAKYSDLPMIVDIYNQAILQKFQTADLSPLSVFDKEEWFNDHTPDQYPIFISHNEDNQLTGWCSLGPWRRGRQALKAVAEISYYVHQGFLRKGVATNLIHHAILSCSRLGIEHLLAILLDKNMASITILEKFYFKKWGHLPEVANFNESRCGQYIYGRSLG